MGPISRKIALGAASAAFLAACSVETGEVVLAVTCSAEECASSSGDLRARIEDCDEDTAWYGDQATRLAAFDTAETLAFRFENVLAGTRCVQAYYDVDTSGTLTAGDIVSSEAVAAGVGEEDDDEDQELDDDPELDVEVTEDEISAVELDLDTVLPPQM